MRAPLGLRLIGVTQAENVGGKVGKLGLGQGDLRHRVLGQHDARADGACRLVLAAGNLLEAWNVGIGRLLLLRAADEMAIGAELLSEKLPCTGSGFEVTPARASEAKAGSASAVSKYRSTGDSFR
jgi:hypothetical protein